MAYYKRDGESLLRADLFVASTGYELHSDNHNSESYPVDGWYWFDTLDQALEFFRNTAAEETVIVTASQLRKAFLHFDLLEAVDAICNTPGQEALYIDWEYKDEFHSDNPLVLAVGAQLGKTPEEVKEIFKYGALLP